MANFDSAPQQTGVIYAQDFTLKSLTLLSPSYGPFEVTAVMVEMAYFEDIFSNVVTGRLVVSDAEGFIEKLNLSVNLNNLVLKLKF